MVKLLGIPLDINSSFLRGPAQAPPLIRQMEREGSANPFSESGREIRSPQAYSDQGDMEFKELEPSRAFEQIRDRLAIELQGDHKVLCLGGDHSITYPVLEAYTACYAGLHVLHLDAHADIYENFEDNPYSHASPFARILEKGKIASLTQVGIRTLTTHQREQVAKYGVRVLEMKDFSLDFLGQLQGPLYISLDLDVLDPAFAPGISHHEPGGLSTRQLLSLLQNIPVPVVGADLVEYNPFRDLNQVTAMLGYKLMKELIDLLLG